MTPTERFSNRVENYARYRPGYPPEVLAFLENYRSQENISHKENIMASKKHPGFKSVQKSIEKEGYSKKAAGAILANSTRNASKAAKKANPNLKKVKGKP